MLITGAGMFGVFLFLTYYLQLNLGFSPTRTGVAFLPMVGALMVMAQLGTTVLVPRLGAKTVIPLGFAVATAGMAWLTGIGLGSTYLGDVLPQLIVIGVGLGLVMPPAMQMATGGVAAEDAGVASATVNAMQQVGGSVGTALLSTLAASAATDYLAGRDATSKLVQAQATIESYTLRLLVVGRVLRGRRGDRAAPAPPGRAAADGRRAAGRPHVSPPAGPGPARVPPAGRQGPPSAGRRRPFVPHRPAPAGPPDAWPGPRRVPGVPWNTTAPAPGCPRPGALSPPR
ncbi:hypothetical protein GCM10020256_04130 [Streptomyces thermocoprophilus]